tara:strand:- start:145 stop:291 length:147 start_codon:yes stop_codon:yes gene_type:complete
VGAPVFFVCAVGFLRRTQNSIGFNDNVGYNFSYFTLENAQIILPKDIL